MDPLHPNAGLSLGIFLVRGEHIFASYLNPKSDISRGRVIKRHSEIFYIKLFQNYRF